MQISSDYARPVIVNGFPCRNCTEVDEAKKSIDPRHPKAGPFGGDAKTDSTVNSSPAVRLGGRLVRAEDAEGSTVAPTSGSQLDVRV